MTERRKKRWFVALAALILLAVGPYLVSRARSAGRRIRVFRDVEQTELVNEPVTSIRILAYNIAHGRGATDDNWEGAAAEKRDRINDIARLISDAEADVVVLNEVDFDSTWSGHQNQAEAIARGAGYPYWVEQRNLDFRFIYGSWKFGNAVLSRFPIVNAEILEYPALRPIERLLAGCKQGALCTLQVSPEQQVRILAVHFEHRSEDVRVKTAEIVGEAAETTDIPLFAAGDFNSTPTSFPVAALSAGGENAMEVLIEAGYFDLNSQGPPTANQMTFPATAPRSVIDWILCPPQWRFDDYRVMASPLSDHRPVVADVRLLRADDDQSESL